MYRAVLFDWDGTLADTRQVVVATFQKVVREEVDYEVSKEFIERRIGTGAGQTFREIFQSAQKPVSDELIKRLLAKKIEVEINMSDRVSLFPGAIKLLRALQGRIKLALASMNNRAVIEDLLDKMEIRNCFNVILTVEEIKKFKPDPEIFLKCAATMRLKPEECIVFEDSIFGVQAAQNAGMDCIAVLTGVYNRKELEAAKPILIIKSLTQIDQILKCVLT